MPVVSTEMKRSSVNRYRFTDLSDEVGKSSFSVRFCDKEIIGSVNRYRFTLLAGDGLGANRLEFTRRRCICDSSGYKILD